MPDSFEPDPLSFLGVKEKELLKKLATLDGLSEEEEIKSLIHVQARRLAAAWSEAEPPKRAEVLKAKSIRIEKAATDIDEPHSVDRPNPSQ